jgi:CRP-like cAMP-binding protein
MADPSRPPPRVTVEMVKDHRLLRGLNEQTCRRLAETLQAETALPGQTLMAEGETASHMFLVLAGELEVLHKGDADHDVRVALLGPGDWVGEMAILGGAPRSATVRAVAPTLLLRLTAADVEEHLARDAASEYAKLLMNVARELARRLRVADRLIAAASGTVAREYVQRSRG